MKKNAIILFAGACALQATAQTQPANDASRSHFGVGVPVWLKVSARFSATRATNPGPAAGSAGERFYDDGYNRVDSTGNAVSPPFPAAFSMPRTSFFGYSSDAQVANLPAAAGTGGALSLHSIRLNGGDYTAKTENDPSPGVEFFYTYDWKSGQHWSASWEAAAGYNHFQWGENGAANSTVDMISDVFALGGVVLPPGNAPYAGPFANSVPGIPVIGSTPARTQATVPAAVTGRRNLEMHAFQIRLGPTLNWTPNSKWQLSGQAGLALGVGFTKLDFAETITVADPTVPVINQNGSSSGTHFWAGLYTGVRISRQLSEAWSAHLEVRHLLTDKIRENGPTRSAAINLSDGFGVAAAISYHF